jgi:hypothetical protein
LDGEVAMNQEPRPRDPLRFFTFAGRLLFLVTVLVSGGLFAWVVLYGAERVPTGSYPIALILIPVVIGAAISFVVAELVLRPFGIPVWAVKNDTGVQQGAAPNGGPATPPSDAGVGRGPPSVS